MPRKPRDEYEAFKTGLDFATVRQMLWVGSDNPKDWKYKRRNTVLGYWHQIKLQLFAQYLDARDAEQQSLTRQGTAA